MSQKNNDSNVKNKNSKKALKGGESTVSRFAAIPAVQAQPLQVKVYNGNFDKALRAFRAVVQKERILSLFKEKSRYEKPSEKRRRKRNEAHQKELQEKFDKARGFKNKQSDVLE